MSIISGGKASPCARMADVTSSPDFRLVTTSDRIVPRLPEAFLLDCSKALTIGTPADRLVDNDLQRLATGPSGIRLENMSV